jgi:hypothetical protein
MHPSGYAVYWSRKSLANLTHEGGGAKEFTGSRSRRSLFFDRVSTLYFFHKSFRLWTFTIPQLQKNYKTTDLHFSSKFSMLLENYRKRKLISSYCYVTEAQKRGNIHFHLVTPAEFIPVKEINDYWCELIGQTSKSAVDLSKDAPNDIRKLPSYLAKYMAKDMEGGGRILHCRSFNSSRDLSIFKPIQLEFGQMPFDVSHQKRERTIKVPLPYPKQGSKEVLLEDYYFETQPILERFNEQFLNQ